MNSQVCFTIGHSTHEVDIFIGMLLKYEIDCIIDVRSSPYSAYSPQFNREYISAFLKTKNITYIFMGDMLGARYIDEALLFPDGKVDFEKVRDADSFKTGVQRVINGIAKGYKISLMCSEKEPFDCHRFVLVSKALQDMNVEINHITPDGIIGNIELEDRMFKKYKMSRIDLFNSEEDNIALVYQKRNKDMAYNAKTKEGDDE